MLARALERDLDLGWVGPVSAFGAAFAALMIFGLAISMRKINKHLKEALEIWKSNDEKSDAFIMGEDYMLTVIGDAGVLLDSPMSKAFVPVGTITRARFANLQFDITWTERGVKKKASFHSMGDKGRLINWVRGTSGPDVVTILDGDSVSKTRAAFNAATAVSILLWIAGMIFL